MKVAIIISLVSGWVFAGEPWLGLTQERIVAFINYQQVSFDASLKVRYDAFNISSQSHFETNVGFSAYLLKFPLYSIESVVGTEYLLMVVREGNDGTIYTSNFATILKSQLSYNINDRLGVFFHSRILSIRNIDFENKDYASNELYFDVANSEIGIRIKL